MPSQKMSIKIMSGKSESRAQAENSLIWCSSDRGPCLRANNTLVSIPRDVDLKGAGSLCGEVFCKEEV